MALATLPPAFAGLANYPQFVLYRLVPNGEKMEKQPVDWRTGQLPPKGQGGRDIWAPFDTVAAVASLFGPSYGVGFSFDESDPFWFLDIDKCLQADNTWSPLALQLCSLFSGAAIEISQSGRGLHIIGTGRPPEHGCKNVPYGLEFYHTGRFVALTGNGAMGDVRKDCSAALPALIQAYFPAAPVSAVAPTDWTDQACPEWKGPSDDDELIRRMLRSSPSTASMFGGKATVCDLWEANETALAATYPSSTGGAYDASSADIALAMHLSFWTGKNAPRIHRLMMRSALKRDKWERDDYLTVRTIPNAIAATRSVYQERQPDSAAAPAAPATDDEPGVEPTTLTGRRTDGGTILTADEQIALWKGFTYITESNVILTATGQMLDNSQFKNRYGGFMFMLDDNGKMTDNAWEAFTHSRLIRMPKVDHSAFRPELEPGMVWERDDESFVNSYRRLSVPRKQGDISLFMRHLEIVLPVKRDRDILLAYMAAVVQHQGTKFQWAPLIQGVEGNGKTLFSRCVAEAVGMRYSHMPRASELAEKFNDWLVGKIFIGVEDVYWPDSRTEIIETLKPMITNNRLPIRAMRRSEQNMDICANFIVNSNHQDAIKKTANDRRWCMLFCAQQTAEDLARDGLNDAYFQRLYGWLNQGGYAVVSEFLYTYQIPAEFGLDCLLSRAPVTSSTEQAITLSLGRVEQEVQEAIEQGLPGFANGWASSLALDKLLRENRMDIMCPRAKRVDLMRSLGWVHHPALRGGRSTACLPGTRDRPVFYIREGSPHGSLRTSQEIIQAYLAAQAPGVVMSVVEGVGSGTV